MRSQALAWLRRALDLWKAELRHSDSPYTRANIRANLVSWKNPAHAFANCFPLPGGVDILKSVPAEERAAWEAFWKDLDKFVRSTWKGGRP